MAVSQLETLLTTTRLKGESLRRRRSLHAGNAIVQGILVAHEAVLRVCRRLGWSPVAEEQARLLAATPPKVLPRCPSFTPPGRGLSPQAEELLRGVCRLQDGSTVPLKAISWRRDRVSDRLPITPVLFHALHWVRELLEAYDVTGDAAYLDRAKELAGRWMGECLYAERPELLWHEHVTPFRALMLCRLWGVCHAAGAGGMEFMQGLVAALVRHAQRLSHDGFYRADHNHGVAQAYGLLALGLVLGGHPEAPRWVEVGRARLESQMADNVSPEGLHREHSPYYQFFVLQQFQAACRMADAYGISFSPRFCERMEAMLGCSAHLVKPNGRLAALGDTFGTSPIVVDPEDLRGGDTAGALALLFSRTQGAEGSPPAATSTLFPRGGCAVLRSGWGGRAAFHDEQFLAVRLSTFQTAHIHRDALSLELYGYGDDLIVDSGGPYEYGHPIRMGFLTCTRAHNTVVVDDRDQNIGEAEIVHWRTSTAYDLLVAAQRNYPGVTHRRAILFVRPSYFVVLDRLEASAEHRYAQLFHLHPALEGALEDLSVSTANSAGGPTVRIVPLIRDGLELRLHRGILRPRQGWVCTGLRQLAPNTVVEYARSGATAAFGTLLIPERPGRPSRARATLDGIPFEGDTRIRVHTVDDCDEILLSAAGDVMLARSGKGTA